jgi:hypothetical protein
MNQKVQEMLDASEHWTRAMSDVQGSLVSTKAVQCENMIE